VSIYEKGLVTILACNALFALVSLPLALRKIPRNGFYVRGSPRRAGPRRHALHEPLRAEAGSRA